MLYKLGRTSNWFVVLILMFSFLMAAQAQDTPIVCDADALASQQQQLMAQLITIDYETDPDAALATLFDVGIQYQQFSIACGYEPDAVQINGMIEQTLLFADIGTILAANAVGDDVDAVLVALDDVIGDPFNGQLLYNGMEPVLDGSTLTCSSCHMDGEIAPMTEGTWTRFDEIRSQEPPFTDYSSVQYFVESILHPNAYIVPGYNENIMPSIYGSRLDIQQLADLVAYIESQDQLLEE